MGSLGDIGMSKLFTVYIDSESDYKKFCEEAEKDNYISMKPLPKTECPHCKHTLYPAILSGLQKERFEVSS